LLEPAAVHGLVGLLFPLARVVTPNIPEARMLGAGQVESASDLAAAAAVLRGLGAAAVLVKGGHLPGGEAIDWLDDSGEITTFSHRRLAVEGHGTGCTLSSAIACGLALGQPLILACRSACDYVHGALVHSYRPGRSTLAVLGHDWQRASR
jgi:hydroxymethylpyrimidine/phosphomethylpyrimidine kinase